MEKWKASSRDAGIVFRMPKFRAAWAEHMRGWDQIIWNADGILDRWELQEKRHLWPRWAALLTLVIAGVAVICQ